MHLAQINIGRLVAPIDDPRIAEFVAQLEPVNKLAEQSPGFVWRLQLESGNATDVPYNDDPTMLVNMSVWESLETLKAYVYGSRHLGVFRDRQKWFQKLDLPHYCLWWVPVGYIPTVAEGRGGWSIIRSTGRLRRRFGFRSFIRRPSMKRWQSDRFRWSRL